jgi:hypothetical protein
MTKDMSMKAVIPLVFLVHIDLPFTIVRSVEPMLSAVVSWIPVCRRNRLPMQQGQTAPCERLRLRFSLPEPLPAHLSQRHCGTSWYLARRGHCRYPVRACCRWRHMSHVVHADGIHWTRFRPILPQFQSTFANHFTSRGACVRPLCGSSGFWVLRAEFAAQWRGARVPG